MEAKVNIYNVNNNYRNNIWYFSKTAKEMINSDSIFIDYANMRIRVPNFDDNRVHKLYTGKTKLKYKSSSYQYDRYDAKCGCANLTDEDISGEYEIEKEGDWFLLNRI